MLVVYGTLNPQNPEGNRPTHLFFYFQEFTGIDDFTMLRIKDVPHMIKDHNSVPNQEARLGAIHQRKLEVLVWLVRDFQRCGLKITAEVWNKEEMMSYITQINKDSQSIGDIKVSHYGKLETGNKRTIWDVKWGNYTGSMVGVSDIPLYYVTC